MSKIRFSIDIKSLYCNIFNDNDKGHTCTVATPIKQGNSINPDLADIYKIPQQIDFQVHPDFISKLIKNSKSKVKINNVFVFDKIMVNNVLVKCDCNYCMFVKEEVDPLKAQFGRIKLHYPFSLKDEDLSIDNKKVFNTISEMLHNYAFIINSFDYDFESKYINFNAQIVGYNNIPYSKVFINNKGTGNKFSTIFNHYSDCYDYEIVYLKKKYGDEVNPNTFNGYMEKCFDVAFDQVESYLECKGCQDIVNIRNLYPYSLFDIQYVQNNELRYGILKGSLGKKIYVELSSERVRFFNLFNNSRIFVVTNCFDEPVVNELDSNRIEKFKVVVDAVRLIEEE